MALTEDVGSEVRRILTNNTIDQCIQYSQNIKRDIAAAQGELRDVIGSRYRELLRACDRVVGMEDICRSIETSYKAGKPHSDSTNKQSQLQQQQLSNSNKGAAGAALVGVPHTVAPQQIRLLECEAALRSSRVLVAQGAFAAAAKACVQFQSKLEELADDDDIHPMNMAGAAAHRIATLKRIGSFLSQEIRSQMVAHLAAHHHGGMMIPANSGVVPATRTLADIHAALEVMLACSPTSALTALLAVHDDVLNFVMAATAEQADRNNTGTTTTAYPPIGGEDEAVAVAHHVHRLMGNLVDYLNKVESNQLVLETCTEVDPPLSLQDLVQVDPKKVGPSAYMAALRLQLCGHSSAATRRFSRPLVPSVLSGWALSPVGAGAPGLVVPREDFRRVEAHALVVLHHILTNNVTTSAALLQIEPLITAPLVAQQRGSLWDAVKWSAAVKATLDAAMERVAGVALEQAQKGLAAAIAAATQPTAGAAGRGSSSKVPLSHDAIIATILAANSHSGITTTAATTTNSRTKPTTLNNKSSTSTGGQRDDDSHDPLFLFKALEEILSTSNNSNTGIGTGGSSTSTTGLASAVVLLLLEGIRSMVDTLSEAVRQSSGASISLSRLCILLLRVLSRVRTTTGSTADASSIHERVVSLKALIEELHCACHATWLENVTSRFEEQASRTYDNLLQCPALLAVIAPADNSDDSAVASTPSPTTTTTTTSSRMLSNPTYHRIATAHTKATLANVWHNDTLEGGTTAIAYPIHLTPGIARALFTALSDLRARREECHGVLAHSLVTRFGTAITEALVKAIQQVVLLNDPKTMGVISTSPSSSSSPSTSEVWICEEAAFQLFFDISLVRRMLLHHASSPPSSSGTHNVGMTTSSNSAVAVLNLLEDKYMDVVNRSVTKGPMDIALEAAVQQCTFSYGLLPVDSALNVVDAGEQQPQQSVASTTTPAAAPVSRYIACSVAVEKESDRLPLLPITTPTQVRSIVTSLQPPPTSSQSSSMNRVGSGSGGVGPQHDNSGLSTASIWSATSKLRNLWGQ